MCRSLWKGPFSLKSCKNNLPYNIPANEKSSNFTKTIKVWCRSAMILPTDVGKKIEIYNGKNWILRKIVEDMVQHKFGEFAFTRKRAVHKDKKIKQKSRKK